MARLLGSYLCIFRRPARIAILGWANSREVSSDLPAFRSSEFPPESGPHAPGGVRHSSAGRQGPWRGDDDAIVLLCQPTCKSQQNCCRPSVRFSVPVFTAGAEDDARGAVSVAFGFDSLTCPKIALESSGARRKGRRRRY